MIEYIRDKKTHVLCRVLHYGHDGFLTMRMTDKKTYFVKREDAIIVGKLPLAPGDPILIRKVA